MKSKEQKREEALERQANYDALSVAEKAFNAAGRPGESKRELARLMRAA